mgnify:FL=1
MIGLNNITPAVSLTSNTSVVNIVEGLTLVKDVDKKWTNGILTYITAINNQADVTYVKTIATDIIDISIVEFIPDSVIINDVWATQSMRKQVIL